MRRCRVVVGVSKRRQLLLLERDPWNLVRVSPKLSRRNKVQFCAPCSRQQVPEIVRFIHKFAKLFHRITHGGREETGLPKVFTRRKTEREVEATDTEGLERNNRTLDRVFLINCPLLSSVHRCRETGGKVEDAEGRRTPQFSGFS
ncbi:hypothetical protein AMECASPLE_006250 [Ameca splendens]|uniref:Uncharacterized protein n=1 Tax=Ameca splendens TaxID=208324 RepID=A0ABV0YAS2_9TELE